MLMGFSSAQIKAMTFYIWNFSNDLDNFSKGQAPNETTAFCEARMHFAENSVFVKLKYVLTMKFINSVTILLFAYLTFYIIYFILSYLFSILL